jgi:hypothetical protein
MAYLLLAKRPLNRGEVDWMNRNNVRCGHAAWFTTGPSFRGRHKPRVRRMSPSYHIVRVDEAFLIGMRTAMSASVDTHLDRIHKTVMSGAELTGPLRESLVRRITMLQEVSPDASLVSALGDYLAIIGGSPAREPDESMTAGHTVLGMDPLAVQTFILGLAKQNVKQ